eukprot:NODE_9948_length_1388_cov_6.140365.p1 GENE.NODE_9948_length_1388_cov_6.140365~~NODE_9948_length_1388_cov_6.140365.p1  ORF type:complete len:262 (+),score=71.75 NODE_9948_length_1388_cov_6.140365:119-787(+)
MPALFADDMLLRYYGKSPWPTLIAGPKGTRSGLHRDTHNLPFYLALFKGRKRFHIFDDHDEGLAAYYDTGKNSFFFDSFAPDFTLHPLLGVSEPYEHELVAGELLYIPNGAPHAAINLEDTIAISGNFLDKRSYRHHEAVTCRQRMWSDSKLCWGYTTQFQAHRSTPMRDIRELSYYELTGHPNRTSWCDEWLSSLEDRATRRDELKRNVPIVRRFCAPEPE